MVTKIEVLLLQEHIFHDSHSWPCGSILSPHSETYWSPTFGMDGAQGGSGSWQIKALVLHRAQIQNFIHTVVLYAFL